MPDIWLDTVTPKISIAISTLLSPLHEKGYSTLVTAKRQTQTTDLLDTLHVPYETVGDYGTTLKEKLAVEQKRTLGFLDLFDRIGYPKVLWTHGDVSAIRTAFGLKIPVVYANDTVFAYAVAKLACPLVDWLVTPQCFGKSWSQFGIPKSRIIQYDGLEEACWLKGTKFEQPKFLEELADKKPEICFATQNTKPCTAKTSKSTAKNCYANWQNWQRWFACLAMKKNVLNSKKSPMFGFRPSSVLTAQLLPYIDLMVGSGGTACRETAMSGIPTINFHFWDVQARYLYKKASPSRFFAVTAA
jgi:predicted glycosyltransferase